MAVLSLRRRDPEGRMPLRAHLVELRNRLFVVALFVVAGAVVGWYLYDWLIVQLQAPLEVVREEYGRDNTAINYAGVTTAFNQRVTVSVWVGVIITSPVWIYQFWAFVTPGLTRRERWYGLGFMSAAVPLFLAGVTLAWLVLPNAVTFLIAFTPDDEISASFLPANEYVNFVTRVMLAFGLAFLTPVVMVALSMAGLVSSRTWIKGWRIAVVLAFVFAAIASPSPDVITMFALAGPMIFLYLVAVVVTVLVDRRRAKRLAAQGGGADVADDAAAPLDAAPAPVEPARDLSDAT
ncbi:MAG: twin-arginine translocase subunit TatC [Kineosporiaceae bacterium]